MGDTMDWIIQSSRRRLFFCKVLTVQTQEPEFDPQTPYKTLGMMVCIYNAAFDKQNHAGPEATGQPV